MDQNSPASTLLRMYIALEAALAVEGWETNCGSIPAEPTADDLRGLAEALGRQPTEEEEDLYCKCFKIAREID